jgi:5-methylthioadenosine/S-adenosylhomocysteine deaminase
MKRLYANGITFHPPGLLVGPVHVLVENGIIQTVSQVPFVVEPDLETLDLKGNLLVPGFLDCHTHLAQSFGRGIYDNQHLTQWLETMNRRYWLEDEHTQLATELALIEAIHSGTTTVSEMTTLDVAGEVTIRAIAASGLRGDVCMMGYDFQEGTNPPPELNASKILDRTVDLHKRWHGAMDGRLTVRVAPVGLPGCTEDLIRGSRALADQLGIGIHTHNSEGETETANAYERFGCSEVEALARFGLLGPDCQLVHSIWLTDRDMDLIAEHGSSVVTCPSTNTKITDGMPPMPGLHRRGVNIAIGCDGEASSGTYDILQEARLVSLLGKVHTGDAAVFPAEVVFRMMTTNGAKAIGLKPRVGEIKEGYQADFTIIRYPAAHLIDERRLLSNLVFSATAGDVLSVIVDGRPVMWNQELLTIDEERVVALAREAMRKATHILI